MREINAHFPFEFASDFIISYPTAAADVENLLMSSLVKTPLLASVCFESAAFSIHSVLSGKKEAIARTHARTVLWAVREVTASPTPD